VYLGLSAGATLSAMTMKLPEKIPAEPTPAIARPTMRLAEEGAAPHNALPASKINNAVMYVDLKW